MADLIVSYVADGMARLFAANGDGTADQFAQIRVPPDFPAERAVALSVAVWEALGDNHGVEVRTANGHTKALPPASGHTKTLPLAGRRTDYDSAAIVAWVAEHGPVTPAQVAGVFGYNDATMRRVQHNLVRTTKRVQVTGSGAWRVAARRKARVGGPANPWRGGTRTDQPGWEACADYIRAHPGITARELADGIGLRKRQDANNRFQMLRSKGLIRVETGDDGMLHAYPLEPAA